MGVRTISLAVLSLGLLSCGSPDMTQRQKDHQLLAKMIAEQNGRFRFIGGTGEYPPMILDTATGCADALVFGDEGKSVERVAIGAPTQMGDGYCRLLGVANVSSELIK